MLVVRLHQKLTLVVVGELLSAQRAVFKVIQKPKHPLLYQADPAPYSSLQDVPLDSHSPKDTEEGSNAPSTATSPNT